MDTRRLIQAGRNSLFFKSTVSLQQDIAFLNANISCTPKGASGELCAKGGVLARHLAHIPRRGWSRAGALDFVLFVTFSLKKEKVRALTAVSEIKSEKSQIFLPIPPVSHRDSLHFSQQCRNKIPKNHFKKKKSHNHHMKGPARSFAFLQNVRRTDT